MKYKSFSIPRPSAPSTIFRKTRISAGHQSAGVLPPRELRRIVAEMLG